MEKVKLTKEQAAVFENMKNGWPAKEAVLQHLAHGWNSVNDYQKLNAIDDDDFIKALYIGYEVEQTPEEKVKAYFDDVMERWDNVTDKKMIKYYEGTHDGIITTLGELGIQIKGVNQR